MLLDYIEKHIAWSCTTFGPGEKTESICRHIEKELAEIRAEPLKLEEWIDVIILGLDGAWRSGHSPEQIIEALQLKQSINIARKWQIPESPDDPIEHIRES